MSGLNGHSLHPMKRIYTWAAKPANRTLTVDTLIKSNNGLYEVPSTYPHRIYFDIDKKDYNDAINDFKYLNDLKLIIYMN